jgi:hypothetical protein
LAAMAADIDLSDVDFEEIEAWFVSAVSVR